MILGLLIVLSGGTARAFQPGTIVPPLIFFVHSMAAQTAVAPARTAIEHQIEYRETLFLNKTGMEYGDMMVLFGDLTGLVRCTTTKVVDHVSGRVRTAVIFDRRFFTEHMDEVEARGAHELGHVLTIDAVTEKVKERPDMESAIVAAAESFADHFSITLARRMGLGFTPETMARIEEHLNLNDQRYEFALRRINKADRKTFGIWVRAAFQIRPVLGASA